MIHTSSYFKIKVTLSYKIDRTFYEILSEYLVETEAPLLREEALKRSKKESLSYYRQSKRDVRMNITDVSESIQKSFWKFLRLRTNITKALESKISESRQNPFHTIEAYFLLCGLMSEEIFKSAYELYVRTHGFEKNQIRKVGFKNSTEINYSTSYEEHFASYVLKLLEVNLTHSVTSGTRSGGYTNRSVSFYFSY